MALFTTVKFSQLLHNTFLKLFFFCPFVMYIDTLHTFTYLARLHTVIVEDLFGS